MSTDNARTEVVQCERDIQSIKTALRKVGAADNDTPNTMIVTWVGKDESSALESDDGLEVSLQLSSPVEEAVLTKMGDGTVEGSTITFSGVETSMATLAVTLKKNGEALGVSESYDLAPLCNLEDAMNPKEEYVSELPVAIVAPGSEAAAAEEAKMAEENKEGETEKEGGSALVKPLCSLTLKLVFKPSAKDQKEELYELLNKTSLRKSQALERLKEEQLTKSSSNAPQGKKPAVKAGFLNKKTPQKPDSKWMQFYEKYLGPQSITRGLVIPIAKNYVIFFGAVILAHFKGQELALPAPV